ncbi:WYL domain-containing protein [Corynebacterium sp. CCM 8835]|uniref:WYL domain-containing protein n=1 Tax=Corynebacterium antarcticum TaxID=2800405 RepID=A0A9Q4C9T4_9CORY|nr:WYL domain-containing protein [Corynebacterium antarcticum]MCK7641388.1 WYL domain-containing protein [Corynebacterium antarcticum]MCK7660510.1 WYL domain-containing protein [Corynebacterium antarcticum]MCL0244619.1 WYL domain-containing protein [Corynebacterium antarcticum]MCX7490989.1 WYL domain-containing protein [Corynebacterium antarcticum]MCX7537015.1 WYL domain-containing protein [Corynebacterium antarcticum]
MTRKDEALERLINLTFAFLDAEQNGGRRLLTAAWVRDNVAGYADRSEDASRRMFNRDLAVLRAAGVPVEIVANPDDPGQTGYRLQSEEYSLPEVSFTPSEATVLALAGDMGLGRRLAAFAQSGWTKLAAAGASRQLGTVPVVSMLNDTEHLGPQTLDTILGACRNRRRIRFTYSRSPVDEAVTRSMDPWGLVSHRDRLYIVGHDVDRDAVRSFRITRISDIRESGPATHPNPGGVDLQDLVARSLRRGHDVVDVRFRTAPGCAGELTRAAEVLEDGIHVLRNVERDWFIRTAAAHAPQVVVTEPEDIRSAVIETLSRVAAGHATENGDTHE